MKYTNINPVIPSSSSQYFEDMAYLDQIARDVEKAADHPYASLKRVLDEAFNQASKGKGIERHANEGERFENQKICEITRRVGLGYPLGQGIKKCEESQRLMGEEGVAELLGAINYIAAAIICMRETK